MGGLNLCKKLPSWLKYLALVSFLGKWLYLVFVFQQYISDECQRVVLEHMGDPISTDFFLFLHLNDTLQKTTMIYLWRTNLNSSVPEGLFQNK